MKLTLQRNIEGLHAPVRLLMERKIVSSVRLSLSLLIDSWPNFT
jgi:Proteasome maturation factor UMP1